MKGKYFFEAARYASRRESPPEPSIISASEERENSPEENLTSSGFSDQIYLPRDEKRHCLIIAVVHIQFVVVAVI